MTNSNKTLRRAACVPAAIKISKRRATEKTSMKLRAFPHETPLGVQAIDAVTADFSAFRYWRASPEKAPALVFAI